DQQQKEQMKLPLEQRRALGSAPAEQARIRRASAARQVVAPASRALALFLASLSRQQWDLVKLRETATLSTTPQGGELPLPDAFTVLLGAPPPVIYGPGSHFADLATEQDARRREKEAQQRWSTAEGFRVTLRLDKTQFETSGSLRLEVIAVPIPSPS